MDYRGKLLTAPLIWFDEKLQRGVQIRLSDAGKIVAIGDGIAKPGEEVHEIQNAVLLPGFVNAHSHAFHRYLRGRSEIGSAEVDTFWKWRGNMYALIKDIDYKKFKEYCYGTFREMLAAGITTVGEFHYVHHGTERFSLDQAVIEAAEEAGIRLVLLETLYCRAGFDATDVLPEQASFKSDLAEFLANVEKLEARAGENTTIGVAAHSFRAVPPPVAQELFQWAIEKNKPFHVHLEEQPKEIEDCERVENCKPSTLLAGFTKRHGHLITAVHCTYTPRHLLDVFAELGVNVCVCPATEGFLGDGIPDLACAKPKPNSTVDKLCLGTDCNNRICMLEEMRWLAFCQNMKNNRRNVGCLTAEKLLRIGTENAANSLGLADKVGSFKEGHYFDFVAFDLSAPRLSVAQTDAQLVDALVFGCGNAEIKAVGVAGVCKH
ncbi:Protein CPIN-1 [Aphelenchoides avenae]|nr:Protein CPIN-1 [Aphelenchus avenae]